MVKDYKYKLQKHKSYWTGAGAMCLSLVTGPLYTIGIAMQLQKGFERIVYIAAVRGLRNVPRSTPESNSRGGSSLLCPI